MKTASIGNSCLIDISKEHSFTTDSVLLAHFANVRRAETAVDLGAGCGIIAFLWAMNFTEKTVHAVEIQKSACELMRNSIINNNILSKVIIHEADLKNLDKILPAGSFDVVASNPPYFKENSGAKATNLNRLISRSETACNLNDIAVSASRLLKTGGRACFTVRPERLIGLTTAMSVNNIEPKEIQFVRTKASSVRRLALVKGTKGGAEGLKLLEDFIMHKDNGEYSDEASKIYNI